MNAADSFAFLLPFILLTFGTVFLIVSRYEKRPALSWAAGFSLAALGFAGPALLFWLPVPLMALICDTLFIGAFFFYGQALLEQFQVKGKPEAGKDAAAAYSGVRMGIAATGFLAVAYVDLFLGRLDLEVIVNDTTCVLLLALPLLMCIRKARHWLEAGLLMMIGLVLLETVLRNVVMAILSHMPRQLEAFAASDYAAVMRICASFFGLLFALFALASVARDVLIRYRHAAECDPLTGMLNRRGFELAVTGGGDPAGAVLVCDIDHFKRINDDYGHQHGDRVLVVMAGLLTRYLPARAVAARFGGEEFVIFLPGYDLAEAEVLANMLRLAIASHAWREVGVDRQVTASFGCAVGATADRSVHERIARADANLYAAKHDGRNRVVALPVPPERERPAAGKPVIVSPVRSYSR